MKSASPDKAPSRGFTALVLALALCAFGRSLFNQFALDDLVHISENGALKAAATRFAGLWEPAFPGNLYRPATAALNALTYSVSGLAPLPYHLTNLLLHLAAVFLVLTLFTRAGLGRCAPVCAALFAVHPLHTEAVANISGRAELLAAVFTLAAVLGAIRMSQRGLSTAGLAGSALLAFLAAASKESGCVAPLLSLLTLRLFPGTRAGNAARICASQLAGTALYLTLRLLVLGGEFFGGGTIDFADNPIAFLPAGPRILNGISGLADYLGLIVVPQRLSADYSWAAKALLPPVPGILDWVWIAVAGSAFAAAAAGIAARNPAGIFMGWFFAAFALTANVLFPIGTIFGERLAYLPSIGVIGCVGALLHEASGSGRPARYLWLLVPAFAGLTFLRCGAWFDNRSIWLSQEFLSTFSTKTQTNLAVLARNDGELEQARRHALLALEIYPRNEDAWRILASIDIFEKDLAGAREKLETALALNPSNPKTLGSYARLLFNAGDIEGARAHFRRMQSIDPHSIEARIGRLAIALRSGNRAEAAALSAELDSRGVTDSDYLALKAALPRE